MDPSDLFKQLGQMADDINDDDEEFQKFKLQTLDGFLIDECRISQAIADDEFTEEFAQKQLKALNFLNNTHRNRFNSVLDQIGTVEGPMGTLMGIRLPLICMAVNAQIEEQFKILERGKEKGYTLKLYAKFTSDELVELEEKRIMKMHGWEDE